jgi:50S ribosomal protein L16 3-hydroxylase
MLQGIRWNSDDVADFLGSYLTEPKPHVVFERPRRIGIGKFREQLAKKGLRLDLKSQMLFRGNCIFINGETVQAEGVMLKLLTELADQRMLPPGTSVPDEAVALLHQWASAGYLHF